MQIGPLIISQSVMGLWLLRSLIELTTIHQVTQECRDQVCGSNGQELGPAVDDVQCTSKTEDNSDHPALASTSAPPPDTTPCLVHQSWNPWTFQYTSICLWYIWCDLDCFLRCFKNEIAHCSLFVCDVIRLCWLFYWVILCKNSRPDCAIIVRVQSTRVITVCHPHPSQPSLIRPQFYPHYTLQSIYQGGHAKTLA